MALRPRINEFVFNHVGTDTAEFIEIKADPNTDLSGYRLIILDGDAAQSGVVDNVITPGTTNAAGYYVTPFFSNALQNGTQTLLLVTGPVTATVNSDVDTNNDGILDSTPWGAIVDSVAVTDGGAGDQTYAGAPVLPVSGGNAVGGASRLPDGQDTDTPGDFVTNDFDGAGLPGFVGTPVAGEALNTPGAVNQAVGGTSPPPPPAPTVTAIHTIQGAAHRSPLVGQVVQTTGIVTAVDRTDSGAQNIGYWLQDPKPDADPATSEAVFVFVGTASNLPAAGSAVTVSGTVTEYTVGTSNLSQTRLTGATTTVTSTGNPLPAATIIGQGGRIPPTGTIYNDAPGNLNTGIGDFQPDVEGIDFFESLEGMRVQVNNAVVTQGTNGFDETWVLADSGAASAVRTPRGGVLLQQADDNPERILFDIDTGILPGAIVPDAKVGDSFSAITGILYYDFGNYRIDVTEQPVLRPGSLVQEITSLRGDAGTLSIAEWNVENLDPSDPKFDAIAKVIGTNLRSPDILALQEIQDSNGATNNGVTDSAATAAKLIATVQAATGITYAYADIAPLDGTSGGEPGGNIRPGFLYRPDRVQLTGLTQVKDTDLSNGDAFANSRLPLVGTFRFNGEEVTLVNVHYSSKGGSTGSYGSVQPPVNGAEAARIAQAVETKKVVDARLAANPEAKIAVLGDHNEFAYNASQQVLTGDGSLTNLDQLLPLNERYTYTFDGNSQALDHTLASQALFDAADFDIVHVNSEFQDYVRVSDHDPSVTTIAIPRPVLAAAFIASADGAIDPAALRTVIATPGIASGHAGPDLFVAPGGGAVRIQDFQPGLDHLTVLGAASDAVFAGRSVTASGTVLTAGDGTSISLAGVITLDRSSLV